MWNILHIYINQLILRLKFIHNTSNECTMQAVYVPSKNTKIFL